MIFPDDYDDMEAAEHERDMPDMPHIYPPEPCSICNKPGCSRGCMRCGKPVCIAEKYTDDSTCGGWILDWWTDGAYDPDDGNEFWCKTCQVEEYGESKSDEPASVVPSPAPAPALPVSVGFRYSDQADDFDPFLDLE